MPEIYEVRRICSYLKGAGLERKKVIDFQLLPGSEKILKQYQNYEWKQLLIGNRLMTLTTKAKYTFLTFEQGTLVWHYRFTGIPHIRGYAYGDRLQAIFNLPLHRDGKRFCRFTLKFEENIMLDFVDIRCLSDIRYYPNKRKEELAVYQQLAPDLTNYQPTSFANWLDKVHNTRRDLKSELQNQRSTPSGIGNYLACEILVYAGLDPWQQAAKLTEGEYQQLCQAIKKIRGYCQQQTDYSWFCVFNRQFCGLCGSAVIKRKHRLNASSQTTHFCQTCQLRKKKKR